MTVAELIEKLKKCDQAALVWVQSESLEYPPMPLDNVSEEKGCNVSFSNFDSNVVLSERP